MEGHGAAVLTTSKKTKNQKARLLKLGDSLIMFYFTRLSSNCKYCCHSVRPSSKYGHLFIYFVSNSLTSCHLRCHESIYFWKQEKMIEAEIVILLRFQIQRSLFIPSDFGLSKWRILPPSTLSSLHPSLPLYLPLSLFPHSQFPLRSRLFLLSFLVIFSATTYNQSRDISLTRKSLFHLLLGFYSEIIQAQRECELWQSQVNTRPFVLCSEPWCLESHFCSRVEPQPSLLKWWSINVFYALLTPKDTRALKPFIADEWCFHLVLFSSDSLLASPCWYIFLQATAVLHSSAQALLPLALLWLQGMISCWITTSVNVDTFHCSWGYAMQSYPRGDWTCQGVMISSDK